MVMLMITCFLVAWLPYALVSALVMSGYKHILSATATMIPAILAKSSAVYNPIVYAFTNPQVWTKILCHPFMIHRKRFID